MKRILSVFLTVAMLASMLAMAVCAYDEDVYNSIDVENVMSFEITDTDGNPKTNFNAGDTIWITAKMDSIWGDPEIEDDIVGYDGNVLPGAYGMAIITSTLVFPTDVFTPKAGKDIKSLDSTINNAGIDPTTEESYEMNITKTSLSDAKEKGMYVFLTESDTFNGDEDQYAFFTGEGLLCRWVLTVKDDAADGIYKLPIGAYKWYDGGATKYEFFGKEYGYSGHSDSMLADRPVKFMSPTDEYVNDNAVDGAYISIQIGEPVDTDAAAKAAAAEVDALIAEIGEVTLDSEDAITAARAAYDALDDAAKAYVTALETLETAEAALAELKAEAEADAAAQAAAAEVDALIAEIGEVTLDSEDAIVAARDAYDALDDAAMAYVTGLETLEAAEAALEELKAEADAAAQAAAAEVDALITAIGEVTLDSEAAIVAARDAYEALDDAAKAYVTGLDTLEAAEVALALLKGDAEAEAAAKVAAAEVDALIAAIGEVTLDSEAAITAARAAYTALNGVAKTYVTGLDALAAAEAALAELKAAAEADVAAKAAAAEVDALIAAIGEVTLDSEAAIVAVRAAYDTLSDAAKAYVTGLDTLVAAEAALALLKGDADAEAVVVDKLIADLGEITLDSIEAVEAARAAYNALSDEAKALVTGLEALEAAETGIKALKVAADKQEILDYNQGNVPAVAPSGVEAESKEEKLTINWDAVEGGAKYLIYVNGRCFGSTSGTTATIARPAGDYEISVRVVLRATYGTAYAAGTSESVSVTVAE